MATKFKYVVYSITFPNGKIYIGKDVTKNGHSIRYFGSWNCAIVEADFTKEELRDFTIRRKILFESDDTGLVSRAEMVLIREHRSNDPSVGYNKSPKFNPLS